MSQQRASGRQGALSRAGVRPQRIVLIAAMAATLGIRLICPVALGVILREGPLAIVLLLAAQGLGAYPFQWLIGRRSEPGWQTLGPWGLGFGVLSLLVLSLGTLGLLQQGLWWTIVGVAAIGGTIRLARICRQSAARPITPGDETASSPWAWLACVPFIVLALLASTMPPGTLWPAEGNGYDVLEYHLGAPRDFLDRGRIEYLPHNIYSNFPLNVEMLYLLAMILRGDPIKAAFAAQLLNLALAALAISAVWLAARRFGRACATIASLVAASCPFVGYLCGVAYVENGMLFFIAMALAALMEAAGGDETSAEPTRGRRPIPWIILAGAMAGFACGCKYLAVPQVLLPLGIAAAWIGRRSGLGVVRALLAYGLPVLVAFAPWLVKNVVSTGSPVFPLARSVFQERAGIWNDDCAARWHEGHLPAPEERSLGGRLGRLWTEILASPRFGLLPLGMIAAAVLIAFRRVHRFDLLPCWLLAGGTLATWIGFTHLVDRFAVLLIPPASLTVAAAAESLTRGRTAARVFIGLIIAANLSLLLHVCSASALLDISRVRSSDGLEWFTRGEWPTHQHVPVLNEIAGRGEHVLVIGDARRFYLHGGVDYCVVFNRSPFAEAAARMSPAESIGWLRKRGYRYVYVDWSEMRRLRASRYGFWAGVDELLFERLTVAGLTPEAPFSVEDGGRAYSTLFRVP